MGTAFVFYFVLIVVIVCAIVKIRKRNIAKKKKIEEQKRIDAQAENERLNEKLRIDQFKKQEERKIANAINAFDQLHGADKWKNDIHRLPDQRNRIDRALYGGMSIIAFDSRYQYARVHGRTGIYITSGATCSCMDYKRRHLPCKHMYFLGIHKEAVKFEMMETDYCTGLNNYHAFLVGRFPFGREKACMALKERGCSVEKSLDYDVDFAIIGKTNAVKIINDIVDREIPCFSMKEALSLFTSEIHHSEYWVAEESGEGET